MCQQVPFISMILLLSTRGEMGVHTKCRRTKIQLHHLRSHARAHTPRHTDPPTGRERGREGEGEREGRS